jgi:hypothetical protein
MILDNMSVPLVDNSNTFECVHGFEFGCLSLCQVVRIVLALIFSPSNLDIIDCYL